MAEPPYAAASVRNSEPILGVLQTELREVRELLEIGSGTGYHAVSFAKAMPHLTWQTSDLEDTHAWIRDAIASAGAPNAQPPMLLDMRSATVGKADYDAVFSCNTAHIMDASAVKNMLHFAGGSLRRGGRFLYYGPLRRAGRFSTESNAAFDASLRARPGDMGIRDIDDMDAYAAAAGMRRQRIYAMPANNQFVVWQKH